MFDFTKVSDENNFEPIPDGWYNACISECYFQDNKAGTGEYLKIKFTILKPTHEGRIVFNNYNTRHPNPVAVNIGMGQILLMLKALGYKKEELAVVEKEQLLSFLDQKELQIKLKIRKDSNYGDTNIVVAYKPLVQENIEIKEEKQDDIPW